MYMNSDVIFLKGCALIMLILAILIEYTAGGTNLLATIICIGGFITYGFGAIVSKLDRLIEVMQYDNGNNKR